MEKLFLSLLLATFFALPSPGHAATNPYESISGSLGLLNNSSLDGWKDYIAYDSGYLANGAIGLKNDFGRIEAEVG
jgi:hypothetical protein